MTTGRPTSATTEADRRGFAYGTLPAHPEQGEEAFHLERHGSRLLFKVHAFSRPRLALARIGAPAARAMQVKMNKAYLRVMREAAR